MQYEGLLLGGGGGGGGGRTVPSARAKTEPGQSGGTEGGKPKLVVSGENIGPGWTADDFLANTGKNNIQLLREKFQRGNAQNSKDSKRQ